MLKRWWKFLEAQLLPLVGAFIMVAGWNWYHVRHRPHLRFIIISLLAWGAVFAGYHLFKRAYTYGVRRFRRHPFWQNEFRGFLDQLWFLVSLLFVIFFFRNELLSLVYVSVLFGLLGWRFRQYLAHHPGARPWLLVNKHVFAFAYFVFAVEALLQYLAHRYYILDDHGRFYNIVFFRAWAMSCFWLLGFVVGSFLATRFTRGGRVLALFAWSLFFVGGLFGWTVNLSVLYYSGLYFSPSAWEHLRYSFELLQNKASLVPALGFLVLVVGFVVVAREVWRAHRLVSARYWYFYQAAVGAVALFSLFAFASFKNTPERAVVKSFYDYYLGAAEIVTLPPPIQTKLERFGLFYRPDEFYVTARDSVYGPSTTRYLLPDKFQIKPPNLVIIFLESQSARLTSVYNPRFPGLTPGLKTMAADPQTTIFKKFYNASTPTITGIVSLLCSFLPPTGHGEIQNQGKFQRLLLLCLPEILKQERGFTSATYITAVTKKFANKGGIFESMGTDTVLGKEELKRYIPGEPLSWGYSDHQMFPVVWRLMQEQTRPYLMMISTVDTHPPFNLAKDAVPYGEGKSTLLNAFHTTDDAFGRWWEDFRASPLYADTVVVAVADHAVFPAAFTKDAFPEEAGKLTFYDENALLIYVPDTVLPKTVELYSSGLDFLPTLLQVFGINIPNSFEGHSIFADRERYPNILGMHELGLYINQASGRGGRQVDYNVPSRIECPDQAAVPESVELTLCEYLHFYRWKRSMFEAGRFWKQ